MWVCPPVDTNLMWIMERLAPSGFLEATRHEISPSDPRRRRAKRGSEGDISWRVASKNPDGASRSIIHIKFVSTGGQTHIRFLYGGGANQASERAFQR